MAEGEVLDSNGKIKYLLNGLWNKDLWYRGPNEKKDSKNAINIVTKLPNHPKMEWMYQTIPIGVQMNNLTCKMLNYLCPTDVRFRPDQRALELIIFLNAIKIY